MNVFIEFLITLFFSFGASLSIYLLTLRLAPRFSERRRAPAMFAPFRRTLNRLFLLSISTYSVLFTTLSSLRYLSFHSASDLGLYDQLVWNALRGRLFENSLLVDAPFYLGKSFSPILLAFVPVYAIWRDPVALLALQTLALGLAAFPIYWFARERLGHALGLVLGLAYFLSPAVESINLTDVHGIAFATPLLSLATYFLLHRRYKPFLVCLALALLVREEIALIGIGFGLYIFIFQRKRRLGLALSALGCVLTVALLTFVIPFFRGPGYGTDFYYFGSGVSAEAQTRYTYLGHSIPEIITTMLTRPNVVLEQVLIPDKIEYVLHFLVPLGLLPLIGLEVTALALPTLGYSLLSTYSFQYSIHSFYSAPLVPLVFFGAALGARRILRWKSAVPASVQGEPGTRYYLARQYALGSLILAASLGSYFFAAPGPFSSNFDAGIFSPDASTARGREIVDSIPSDATVVAQTELVAHLSARRFIYDFPAIPDYRQADYLAANTERFWYGFHKPSLDTFFRTGYFEIIKQSDGFILARRRTIDHPRQIRYAKGITLLGYSFPTSNTLYGGMTLRPIVFWRAEKGIAERYKMSVQVVDAQGHIWAQEDREPDDGFSPTNQWGPYKIVGDQYALALVPTMPSGGYDLTIAVHKDGEGDYLDAFDEQGNPVGNTPVVASLAIEKNKLSFTASELTIEQPLFVDMEEIRFLGYALRQPRIRAGEKLHLGLYWRARAEPDGDYTVAVQLRDRNGRLAFEQSSRPANGTYPTNLWDAGEVLLDWHDFDLPQDIVAGDYQLVVVLRDEARNHVLGQVNLPMVTVAPSPQ